MQIKTASWFTKLPDDHVRIGISRGTPRGQPAGYRRYRALEPGPWFNSSTITQYLQRYGEILARLDPAQVAADLEELAGPDQTAVMLCFESPAKIATGACWCHRHLAGQWLQDHLGVQVEEFGWPQLDPWPMFRQAHVEPPDYRR